MTLASKDGLRRHGTRMIQAKQNTYHGPSLATTAQVCLFRGSYAATFPSRPLSSPHTPRYRGSSLPLKAYAGSSSRQPAKQRGSRRPLSAQDPESVLLSDPHFQRGTPPRPHAEKSISFDPWTTSLRCSTPCHPPGCVSSLKSPCSFRRTHLRQSINIDSPDQRECCHPPHATTPSRPPAIPP